MLQENEKEHTQVIDFISDACKVLQEVKGLDGKPVNQMVLDTKRVWYKTQNINSMYFGRSVVELEQYENLAEECFNHMSAPRAAVLASQIRRGTMPYRYSIDSKSSETQRDKNNAQMTLVDKLNKNKSEHVYTLKEDVKNSLWSGLMGKKAEHDDR